MDMCRVLFGDFYGMYLEDLNEQSLGQVLQNWYSPGKTCHATLTKVIDSPLVLSASFHKFLNLKWIVSHLKNTTLPRWFTAPEFFQWLQNIFLRNFRVCQDHRLISNEKCLLNRSIHIFYREDLGQGFLKHISNFGTQVTLKSMRLALPSHLVVSENANLRL